MIEAFGRASYARYDESSATRLVEMAQTIRDEYGGDLRKLAEGRRRGPRDGRQAAAALQGLRRDGLRHLPARGAGHLDVGPAALRPAGHRRRQTAWPARRIRRSWRRVCLRRRRELAAALVRASLDDDVRTAVAG